MKAAGDAIPLPVGAFIILRDLIRDRIGVSFDDEKRDLLEFTRRLTGLFHTHPVLRRRKFFQGRKIRGSEVKDLTWLRNDGREMTERDWRDSSRSALALRLAGDAIDEVDARGERVTGDTLLILMNANAAAARFVLPAHRPRLRWDLILDTREPTGRPARPVLLRGGSYELEPRSLALFRLQRQEEHK